MATYTLDEVFGFDKSGVKLRPADRVVQEIEDEVRKRFDPSPGGVWFERLDIREISMPKELEEAALIDGCGRFKALFKIIIPLTLPGLGATFIFCFLGSWNEYLFALIINNAPQQRTLMIGLYEFLGRWMAPWESYSAAAITFAIPPSIFFALLEKAMVRGLTAGAMKG